MPACFVALPDPTNKKLLLSIISTMSGYLFGFCFLSNNKGCVWYVSVWCVVCAGFSFCSQDAVLFASYPSWLNLPGLLRCYFRSDSVVRNILWICICICIRKWIRICIRIRILAITYMHTCTHMQLHTEINFPIIFGCTAAGIQQIENLRINVTIHFGCTAAGIEQIVKLSRNTKES